MGDIRLGKCKNICVVLVLALILTTQAFVEIINYTHADIISNICAIFVPEKV